MIYQCVTMHIRPGKLDEFLAAARAIRPLVLAEAGCVQYDYTLELSGGDSRQEPVNPDRVTLYERWESLGHLAAHSAAAHMQDFVARVGPLRERVMIRCGQEI